MQLVNLTNRGSAAQGIDRPLCGFKATAEKGGGCERQGVSIHVRPRYDMAVVREGTTKRSLRHVVEARLAGQRAFRDAAALLDDE